jgi:hypothetical protein
MNIIRTTAMSLALFLTAALAHAQEVPPCLPATNDDSTTASPIYIGMSKNGVWVEWYCYSSAGMVHVVYVGTLAELAKAGGRVSTIIKATDPLRSLQTAGSRFTILPLTDPSLKNVLADMK